MAYVHSRGICHGDLKACNVLVASDPERPFGCCAKVSDFGLSRALALGASHLSTRTYGTVTHMAPELLASGHLRQASDVYSFGIMGGWAGWMQCQPACLGPDVACEACGACD
jgi:serine/threonine protein kinase